MVVACLWLVDAGRRDSHAGETKLHPEGIGDGVTIFWADDVHRGIRRSGGLSQSGGKTADYQDDKKLSSTEKRKEHSARPP
jgi:hypothetical protein